MAGFATEISLPPENTMILAVFSHGLLSVLFKQGALAHEINSELLSLLSPVCCLLLTGCDALDATLMDNK